MKFLIVLLAGISLAGCAITAPIVADMTMEKPWRNCDPAEKHLPHPTWHSSCRDHDRPERREEPQVNRARKADKLPFTVPTMITKRVKAYWV